MQQRLSNYVERIELMLTGDPWYGSSAAVILDDVTAREATIILENSSHNIAELVRHINSWSDYTLQKIKGNSTFEIDININEDWPIVKATTTVQWDKLKENLFLSHHSITHLLLLLDDDFLDQQVVGRNFHYDFLINGMCEHFIYHLGQISLLKKMIRNL
jgi:hypothetical protein